MQIKIRDENGIEEVLYDKYKFEPKKENTSSLFTIIFFVFWIVLLVSIYIKSSIPFVVILPSFGLIAFLFILVLIPEIETIILDKGLKSVIITYKHHTKNIKTLKTIKFLDIKEIIIKDAFTEEGYDRFITLVKRKGKWYSGVNCYYIDIDKKSRLLYEAQ